MPRKDASPGDLAVWPGHIGICIDNQRMVAAASPKLGTIVDQIDSNIGGWPTIRRPKAYSTPTGVAS